MEPLYFLVKRSGWYFALSWAYQGGTVRKALVECRYDIRRFFFLLVASHQPVVRWADSMRYRESFRSRVRKKKAANTRAPITRCESGCWPMMCCIICMNSWNGSITNVPSLSQEAGPCAASVGRFAFLGW